MMRRMRTAMRASLVTGGLLLASGSVLVAHDFWLVPDAFSVAARGRIAVRGQTSSLFPTSLSAVTPDRIVEARVVTATSDVKVAAVSVAGTSLRLGHRPAGRGQHVIGVRLAPRTVRESPASFRRYLDLEGAPEARLRYERDGRLPPVGGDSLTRRYAKYAKTVVEVGKGARAFDRVLGHPLEIIPLSDPSALRAGDTLRVRLILLGESARGAKVHAGFVLPGPTALTDTAAARRSAVADVSAETDSSGIARIVVKRAGLWNIRTIQIVPAPPGSGADWDVHWATVVFPVAAAPRANQSTIVRDGSSPQLAADIRGTIRMIFGRKDTIFAVTSRDGGARFSAAATVGIIPGMHLGNSRGPTIASSRTRSVVVAVDTAGNITTFQLDHARDRWTKHGTHLNDAPGSAPEGLATVAANDADEFHAVWLDLREGRQNQIYFGRVAIDGATRTANRRLYASPDGHVCECCRPNIAIRGRHVAVMFRNWLDGARDMYLTTSADGGRTFSPAAKVGAGTWKLDACPMDGGNVAVDARGIATTVWRRELTVYRARVGEQEIRIGEGRAPMIANSGTGTFVVRQDGQSIKLTSPAGATETVVGEGRHPQALALPDSRVLVTWELAGQVHFQTFSPPAHRARAE